MKTSNWKDYLPFFEDVGIPPPSSEAPVIEYADVRGLRLAVERYPSPGSAVNVFIIHGAGGYARIFMPYARALQQAGYEVYVPDMPGYGNSKVPAGIDVTHSLWEACLADLIDKECKRNGRPCVLLGCSIGGFLAYQAACMSPHVKGLVATLLANPQEPMVRKAFARYPLIGRIAEPLLSALGPLARLRVPLRWLANMSAIANDRALVDVFLRDPSGGGNRLPLSFVRSLLRAGPAIEPSRFDRCPVLVIHPAKDRWTPPDLSLPMYEVLPVRKKWVWLENCGHFPVEQPGLATMQTEVLAFLEQVATSFAGQT